MKNYQPISCRQHSEYELLALRQTLCELVYLDSKDQKCHLQGIIKDIYVKNHAEYCSFMGQKQQLYPIRLDKIISAKPL